MLSRKQVLLLVVVGIGLALITYGITGHSLKPGTQALKKEVIRSVPKVLTCAKGLRVVKAEFVNDVVRVHVENITEVGIVAAAMKSTDGKSAYTVTIRTAYDGNAPTIVIKPHGTAYLEMETENIFPGGALVIEGVTYADGKEEGCDLQTLRELKVEETRRNKESPK